MSTAELKERIIRKINSTNNVLLLEDVSSLLSLNDNKEPVELPEELVKELEEALAQARRGEVVSNEEVFREIEEWLENE